MRKILVATLLAVCACAHAAPEGTPDDLGSFLSSKGLITRLDRARQAVSNKAADLVITSMGFLGVPYKRGGSSLETGFDCSGFVRAMYEQVSGLVLPHKAEQQAAQTQKIMRDELQPGDLVFFNTMRRAFSHVGIYVGDGKFIHSSCPQPGIVGFARVASGTRADPTQFDKKSPYYDAASKPEAPRWLLLDVQATRKTRLLGLPELRETPQLADMILLKRGNRLSITPVEAAHWRHIEKMLAD